MSEPPSFMAILDFAERDYQSACRFFLRMVKDGSVSEQHRREIEMLRQITNTLQVVGRDVDGFKAWSAGVYKRHGPLPPRTNEFVIEAEKIARGGK